MADLPSPEVRVTNASDRPCAFAGRYPVEVKWARVVGPGPASATGVLPAGATYVQPYRREPSQSCPWGGPDGPAQLSVLVEGDAHVAAATAEEVHQVEICESASALPAHVFA